MTNQEWMLGLNAEELYDVMDWVMHSYGKYDINTRLAVIDWLKEEHKPKSYFGQATHLSPPHND